MTETGLETLFGQRSGLLLFLCSVLHISEESIVVSLPVLSPLNALVSSVLYSLRLRLSQTWCSSEFPLANATLTRLVVPIRCLRQLSLARTL